MKYAKFLGVLVFIGFALYLLMYARAKVVQVEYTDVYLKDLPVEFDGTKILYVSDIHISSKTDIRHAQKLMEELQAAQPDLLLLGGDYSDVRSWNLLRTGGDEDKKKALTAKATALSHEWMRTLADFDAPLGKFAVRGNHDASDQEAEAALAQGGVKLLVNDAAMIKKSGAELVIAGVDDYSLGVFDPYVVAAKVRSDQCCILLSHNPDALPQMYTIDSDGGAWIDLALCGHTHGGQVRFGNWVPINKSEYGLRYLSGWVEQPSGYSLTSNGVGTTALPIRFGAPAQAHVITLHRSLPVE